MAHESRAAVFSQLISFLPDREFRRCVERHQGDSRLRGFSCWDQYLSMAFAVWRWITRHWGFRGERDPRRDDISKTKRAGILDEMIAEMPAVCRR